MAANSLVTTFIEFIRKGTGAKQATDDLDKLKKKGKQTEKGMNALGKSAAGVKTQLTGLIGGALLARFAAQSIQLSAQVERSFNAIGKQMESMGLAADQHLPRVESFIDSLEETTGVLVQDATPAFQKFLGITKDVDGAMFAVKLSADLTNAGLGDMRTNGERLANLLQGEVTEAAKSLGLQLRDSNGIVKTQTALLDELISLYGGFSEEQKDAQSELESFGSQVNKLKRDIGAGLAPAVKVLNVALKGVVNFVKSIGIVIGSQVGFWISAFTSVGSVIKKVFDFKKLLKDPAGFFREVTNKALAEGERLAKGYVLTQADMGQQLKDLWAEEEVDFGDKEKGKAALAEIASAKEKERATRAAQRRAQTILQAEVNALETGSKVRLDKELELLELQRQQQKTAAEQRGEDTTDIDAQIDAQRLAKLTNFNRAKADAEKAASEALLAQQIESLDEFSEKRLELELEALGNQREKATEAALKIGADTQKIHDTFDLARLAKIEEFNETKAALEAEALTARMEAEREAGIAELELAIAMTQEGSAQRFELEQALLEEQRIAQEEALLAVLAREMEIRQQQGLDTVDLEKQIQAQLRAVQSKTDAARTELTQTRTDAQKQQNMDLANATIEGLSAIFGENKAFAIAAAIMSTYQGVAAALTIPPPAGYIFAAITAAKGLAAVAKITKQKKAKSKGFDDPAHDRLAVLGGRRWAEDMVRHMGAGFSSGLEDFISAGGRPAALQQGSTSQATTNNRTYNMGSGGLLVGRAGLRKLRRQLRQAEIDEQGREIR